VDHLILCDIYFGPYMTHDMHYWLCKYVQCIDACGIESVRLKINRLIAPAIDAGHVK